MSELSEELGKALGELDTPTVCNALEAVDPSRRARGFNTRPLVCVHPELPPIVGFARTARIRAQHRPAKPQDSVGYYTYIAEGGPVPSIAVIQDLDDTPGYGALWGEVNTNVHYGLGCVGLARLLHYPHRERRRSSGGGRQDRSAGEHPDQRREGTRVQHGANEKSLGRYGRDPLGRRHPRSGSTQACSPSP